MSQSELVVGLDELRAAYLHREQPFRGVDEVSRNDIRRKLEVYCFDCPLHSDDALARAHGYRELVAPVTLTPLWALPPLWAPGEPVLFGPDVPEKQGGFRTELPTLTPFSKGVNTGTEWEYFAPLYPGDQLEGNWQLIDLKPRETRLGMGVFLTVETTILKTTGELVAKNRNTSLRFEKRPDSAPRERGESSPEIAPPTTEPASWNRSLRFSEVGEGDVVPPYTVWLSYQRIVMSVAADRMFSGVHHNRDEARGKGFSDVIFNTRGYEMLFEIMLRRWMGLDGRLAKLGPFRIVASSHPGDTVSARARVIETIPGDRGGRVRLEVVVVNPRGEAARGQAEVTLS